MEDGVLTYAHKLPVTATPISSSHLIFSCTALMPSTKALTPRRIVLFDLDSTLAKPDGFDAASLGILDIHFELLGSTGCSNWFIERFLFCHLQLFTTALCKIVS